MTIVDYNLSGIFVSGKSCTTSSCQIPQGGNAARV